MYMNKNMNTGNPVYAIEMREIIQKLKENGYTELVECLLDNESDCYTKRGRLNKSATIRKLGWKSKQLEDALAEMKDILKIDFLDDEEDEDEDEDEEGEEEEL
mgnify:CR=1 FL=1|jgi:hypothetical protein